MNLEKDKTIETLRGAAIILVVIGHVIGSGADAGMKVSNDSFLRYFYNTFIDSIQMPLFTVIAGLVYSLRPVVYEKINDFIFKKALRVLVPMLTVGTCYFLIQYYMPGTNNKENLSEIWRLLLFPFTLYWYLYSLFGVFVIVAFLDTFNKMKTFNNWLIIFSISVFILLIRDVVIPFESPNYFSYKGTMYLFPCFILGVGLTRFKTFFQNKILVISIPIVLTVSIIIQQLSWFKVIDITVYKDSIFGLLIGLTGTLMLIRFQFEKKWLIWFGGFAYSIYLFHGFGTSGGRIILKRFDIQSSELICIVSLATGLSLPILTEKILERFKTTRFLFLGKR